LLGDAAVVLLPVRGEVARGLRRRGADVVPVLLLGDERRRVRVPTRRAAGSRRRPALRRRRRGRQSAAGRDLRPQRLLGGAGVDRVRAHRRRRVAQALRLHLGGAAAEGGALLAGAGGVGVALEREGGRRAGGQLEVRVGGRQLPDGFLERLGVGGGQ